MQAFTPRRGWHYDLHRSLEDMPAANPKPSVLLKDEDIVSCGKYNFSRRNISS
jgi:hypothetical protein